MAVSPSSENSTNVRSYEWDSGLRAWADDAVVAFDTVGGVAGSGQPRASEPPPQEKKAEKRAPGWMRTAFGVLGVVAPALAAVWAERLFCRAPRAPASPAERTALTTARRGEVVVNGQRLTTWTWGEGPVALLVHGWGGRGGQLHGFVPGLLAAGFSVVTFDGPGHGRSEGGRSSLVEIGRAVRAIAEAVGGARVVVTHSMGGPAAALAMEWGMQVEAAVFVSPPFAAVHWVAPFASALGLTERVRDAMVRRLEERVGVRLADLTMARTAPRMTAPLLVIHDRDDKEVPHEAGAGIVARWPGARLHTTQGLGHKRILGDAEVVARAVGFLASEAPTGR